MEEAKKEEKKPENENKKIKLTIILIAVSVILVLVVGCGFLIVKHGKKSGQPLSRNFANGPRSGGQFGQGRGKGNFGGSHISGQISKIDGNNITVTSGSNTKVVVVSDTTKIREQRNTIKISDLKVGDNIVASGDLSNGQIQAQLIMVRNINNKNSNTN